MSIINNYINEAVEIFSLDDPIVVSILLAVLLPFIVMVIINEKFRQTVFELWKLIVSMLLFPVLCWVFIVAPKSSIFVLVMLAIPPIFYTGISFPLFQKVYLDPLVSRSELNSEGFKSGSKYKKIKICRAIYVGIAIASFLLVQFLKIRMGRTDYFWRWFCGNLIYTAFFTYFAYHSIGVKKEDHPISIIKEKINKILKATR